jgi:hypothetical protein
MKEIKCIILYLVPVPVQTFKQVTVALPLLKKLWFIWSRFYNIAIGSDQKYRSKVKQTVNKLCVAGWGASSCHPDGNERTACAAAAAAQPCRLLVTRAAGPGDRLRPRAHQPRLRQQQEQERKHRVGPHR